MTLAAAQVIEAVADSVRTVAATGSRCYTDRIWPLAESDLPAWRVTAEGEQIEPADVAGLIGKHSLAVQVRGYCRASQAVDAELHALTAAALTAVFDGEPSAHGLQLEAIDRFTATEGEAAVGVVSITLRATYYVAASAPEVIL